MAADPDSDTVHLDSIQLRLIAESASGSRGFPVTFVALPDGTVEERKMRPKDVPPGSVVIPAHTKDMVPDKPPLTVATIQAQGTTEPIDLLELPNGLGRADAVFWSESAVEKFLIPYYASVYGNQATQAVGDLLEAFHGDRGDGAKRGEATPPEVQTYAIAHIPKSEYVLVGGESDIGRDVAVIYREPEAPVLTALMLRDFLRLRRGGG
jgi:hypothetical protein